GDGCFVQFGADDAQLAGDVGGAGADLMLAGHHVKLQPAFAAVHNALGAQDHAVIAAVQLGEGFFQRFTAELVGRLTAPAGEHLVGVVVVVVMPAAANAVLVIMVLVVMLMVAAFAVLMVMVV